LGRKKFLLFAVMVIFSCISGIAESGTLSDSGMDLTNVYNSSISWGDIDNDGDFDLAIMGWDGTDRYFQIYKNGANNRLTLSQSLTGVSHGCLSFGDYDRDGDLDLAITGRITEAYGTTKIYQNDGKGSFSDSGIEIIDVYFSGLAWGDYDNDGDLDLALVGFRMGTGYTAKIYENKGNGMLEDSGITDLTPVASGSVAWADYDNDGDLDLALSGERGVADYICKIYKNDYRNNSANPFSTVGESLTGVRNSSIAWGDYNNDGWLDIAISGESLTSGYVCEIWKNGGDGNFSETSDILTGVSNSSLAWGDYDNDGDLDLVVIGLASGGIRTSKIYKNSGSPGSYSFSEDISLTYLVDQGSVAWCDYDGDKDIDLALTGFSASGPVTKIYKNSEEPNTLPTPPDSSKFETTYSSATQQLTIKWESGWDDETMQSTGLYYNSRIGSESGKDDLVAARYGSPLLGNFISKSTTTVHTLTFTLYAKGYYWSVQAIDTGLGYSWSQEETESGWSEEGHYDDTSPPPAPETPTDEGQYTYNTTVRFSWTQNNPDPETAIYNYRLQVRCEDGTVFDGNVGNVKSYSVSGCEYNKTYEARVIAQSGGGWSNNWSGWSDGIMVVRLLDISNNLIHPREAGDKTAAIKYYVINPGKVSLKIYNLMGELVKILVDDENKEPDLYEEPWSGENEKGSTVASGIYLVHIEVAGENATEKICVVK